MRDPVIDAAIKASCEVGDALDHAQQKIHALEDEIVVGRAFIKVVATRLLCGCWSRDCTRHGAYDPDDHAKLNAIVDAR